MINQYRPYKDKKEAEANLLNREITQKGKCAYHRFIHLSWPLIVDDKTYSPIEFMKNFVFVKTGKPCGIKVEKVTNYEPIS